MPDTLPNPNALASAVSGYQHRVHCARGAEHCPACQGVVEAIIHDYLAAQPVLDETALANLITWKELPFGGNPDNYIRLDANAAHKVIELLRPHLAITQPEVNDEARSDDPQQGRME